MTTSTFFSETPSDKSPVQVVVDGGEKTQSARAGVPSAVVLKRTLVRRKDFPVRIFGPQPARKYVKLNG